MESLDLTKTNSEEKENEQWKEKARAQIGELKKDTEQLRENFAELKKLNRELSAQIDNFINGQDYEEYEKND